jgi:hypothetical protein
VFKAGKYEIAALVGYDMMESQTGQALARGPPVSVISAKMVIILVAFSKTLGL